MPSEQDCLEDIFEKGLKINTRGKRKFKLKILGISCGIAQDLRYRELNKNANDSFEDENVFIVLELAKSLRSFEEVLSTLKLGSGFPTLEPFSHTTTADAEHWLVANLIPVLLISQQVSKDAMDVSRYILRLEKKWFRRVSETVHLCGYLKCYLGGVYIIIVSIASLPTSKSHCYWLDGGFDTSFYFYL